MDVVRKIRASGRRPASFGVKLPGGEYDVAGERGDAVGLGLATGGDHVEGCASWPARCA